MIWREEYKIEEKITYKKLTELMMNTANCQSSYLHNTVEEFLNKGYTWMLYKWRFEIERMPEIGETIKIDTWASEFKRLNACREFNIYNQNDELLVKVSAIFLVIDMKDKKPIRIPEILAKKYEPEAKKNFKKIERIKQFGEIFSEKEIEIKKENIDVNEHVNNTVYIDWISKSIPYDFKEKKSLKELNLVYNREIVNNKKVTLKNYIEGDKIYTEILTKNEDGKYEENAKSITVWR